MKPSNAVTTIIYQLTKTCSSIKTWMKRV